MTNEKLSPIYQAAGQGDLPVVEPDSAEVEDVSRDQKETHNCIHLLNRGKSELRLP